MNRRLFCGLAVSGMLLAAGSRSIPGTATTSCSRKRRSAENLRPESPAPPAVTVPAVAEDRDDSDLGNDSKPIDGGMQQVLGIWNIEAGRITSPEDQLAVLQLPFSPPSEYVVSLRAKRLTGNRALVIGLPAGDQQVLFDFSDEIGGVQRPGARRWEIRT